VPDPDAVLVVVVVGGLVVVPGVADEVAPVELVPLELLAAAIAP
jgi:hypothetical protein